MILTTAAVLVGAGILLFVAGFVLSRPELAMFGAIIVVAAGAAGVAQGYEVQVGETEETVTTNETVALTNIGDSNRDSSKDLVAADGSPTGVDFSMDGRHMFVVGVDNASVHSFDSDRFSLTTSPARATLDVSAQDANPTDVAVAGSGSWMYVLGSDTGTIYQYRLSEPYNITTASLEGSAALPEVSSPQAIEPTGGGTSAVVADGAGLLHGYDFAGRHNVSSVSHAGSFNSGAQEGSPTGLGFNDDGTRMVLVGDQGVVFQYSLSSAHDVESASYTGNYLNVSADAGRPSAVGYEDSGRSLFVPDLQTAELTKYDSGEQRSTQQTSKEAVYQDVELPAGFPLGAVVLLLGTVMLMGSAGEASENDYGLNGGD